MRHEVAILDAPPHLVGTKDQVLGSVRWFRWTVRVDGRWEWELHKGKVESSKRAAASWICLTNLESIFKSSPGMGIDPVRKRTTSPDPQNQGHAKAPCDTALGVPVHKSQKSPTKQTSSKLQSTQRRFFLHLNQLEVRTPVALALLGTHETTSSDRLGSSGWAMLL